MNLISLYTPNELTPVILAGCHHLVPDCLPVFIQRLPEATARINKCTHNVRQYLEANPGEMILGWEVTVWDGILLDCIGHAVVKTQEGLRCITPTRYGEAQLLFVPDPRLSFDFDDPMARMPAKQIALSNRTEVLRFIAAHREEREIRIKYPVSTGNILVTEDDAKRLQRLVNEQQRLAIKMVLSMRNPNGPCLCGSPKKFRKCCKTALEKMV